MNTEDGQPISPVPDFCRAGGARDIRPQYGVWTPASPWKEPATADQGTCEAESDIPIEPHTAVAALPANPTLVPGGPDDRC